MTKRLLTWLGETRGSLSAQLALAALVLALLPACALADLGVAAFRELRTLSVLRETTTTCSAGHVVQLRSPGGWTCSTCQLPSAPWTHGYHRCRHCGTRDYAVACPCGQIARNPLRLHRR